MSTQAKHHWDLSSTDQLRSWCVQFFQRTVRYSCSISSSWLSSRFLREHLCGFDLNLTYPQGGVFPTLVLTPPTSSALSGNFASELSGTLSWKDAIHSKYSTKIGAETLGRSDDGTGVHTIQRREERRMEWKRDLSGRANGTLDPFYGCFLFNEMVDYAVNFSFPWCMLFFHPQCQNTD